MDADPKSDSKEKRVRSKKKNKTPGAVKVDNKDKSLDGEGVAGGIERKVSEDAVTFFCFRCNEDRTSINQFEWSTSAGVKIICSGCKGNLLSLKPLSSDSEAKDNKRKKIDGKKSGGKFDNRREKFAKKSSVGTNSAEVPLPSVDTDTSTPFPRGK